MSTRDRRPANGGWAPGDYTCRCCRCGVSFIGAKHAVTCAECAYGDQGDRGVRELAEEIAGDKYPTARRGDPRWGVCALHWEGKLAAFFAERETEREAEVSALRRALDRRVKVVQQALVVSGQVAALRGALEEAREAIALLPEGALGRARGLSPEMDWPLRDELLDRITKALAPDAGRAEGEALRAGLKWEADETKARDAHDDRVWDVADKSKEDLYGKLCALRAARGGEGEGEG